MLIRVRKLSWKHNHDKQSTIASSTAHKVKGTDKKYPARYSNAYSLGDQPLLLGD
jgi:hypothetical protein